MHMASKSKIYVLVLFLSINLLFFDLVSSCGSCPKPPKPKPPPPPPPSPRPPVPCPPPPCPPSPSSAASCPTDVIKMGVCMDHLLGLVDIVIGNSATAPCCAIMKGMADMEAAVCLCTAIKANILGMKINIPLISLTMLLNVCQKDVPPAFECP